MGRNSDIGCWVGSNFDLIMDCGWEEIMLADSEWPEWEEIMTMDDDE